MTSAVRIAIAIVVFAAASARAQQPAPIARAQTPTPPFPYRVEEVTFESAPGVRLAGTLTIPPGEGPFPAVVLVSGSGPHDRNGGGGTWTPSWVIADRLARHGVAALRYDKRGVAQSSGSFATATILDFAADAEAAVRFLRQRPRIAPDRVGIAGHSEGGVVAPIVTARTRDVAFVVLIAAPGLPGDSTMLLQRAATLRSDGVNPDTDRDLAVNRRAFAAIRAAHDSADAAARLRALQTEVVAERPPAERDALSQRLERGRAMLLTPWWRHFSTYDPRPALRQIRVPVLALTGSLDVQAPADQNLAEIAAALDAGGNRDHHVVAVPGVNHLLQRAKTGSPAEYDTLPDIVAPVVLELITNWVVARARAPR